MIRPRSPPSAYPKSSAGWAEADHPPSAARGSGGTTPPRPSRSPERRTSDRCWTVRACWIRDSPLLVTETFLPDRSAETWVSAVLGGRSFSSWLGGTGRPHPGPLPPGEGTRKRPSPILPVSPRSRRWRTRPLLPDGPDASPRTLSSGERAGVRASLPQRVTLKKCAHSCPDGDAGFLRRRRILNSKFKAQSSREGSRPKLKTTACPISGYSAVVSFSPWSLFILLSFKL